jgi:hypothetical protein
MNASYLIVLLNKGPPRRGPAPNFHNIIAPSILVNILFFKPSSSIAVTMVRVGMFTTKALPFIMTRESLTPFEFAKSIALFIPLTSSSPISIPLKSILSWACFDTLICPSFNLASNISLKATPELLVRFSLSALYLAD